MLRALSEEGLEDWRALEATAFFPRLLEKGKVVRSELAAAAPAGWAAALRHETIPFVSYPYEWSFSMLRDAALLQLELLDTALDEGMTLKDATPYNVQWRGVRPVFADVGSFERLRPGEPWEGYRQFCTLFLYPLMLQAYRGVPFNAWLRGSLDGIEPAELRALLPIRHRFRRGVLTHVVLHAALERRNAARGRDVRGELRAAGFGAGLIRANVRRLRRLVEGLDWEAPPSAWTEYGPTTSYGDADAERKEAFVREAASSRPRRLVWDLGANDGRFTRIAAESADYAVALDADPAVVDALYRALAHEGNGSILPLAANLLDPSPGLGWRGQERRPLEERGRPDLVLCLALLHHLAIPGNVPLSDLVEWLRSLESELVVEFARREDPMVERLLAAKREGLHGDYDVESFERLLGEAFEVERREELATRVLYRCRPRA